MNDQNRTDRGIAPALGLRMSFAFCFFSIALAPAAAQAGTAQKTSFAFSFDDTAGQESLFTVAPSSKIEWIASAGRSGKSALKVAHIPDKSYTSSDNAVRLTLAKPLPAGGVYRISAWFFAPAIGNEGKDTLTGPGVVLNGEYPRGDMKLPSNFGTMAVGEWKEVNVRTPLMEVPLKTVDFRLVVNEKQKHPDVWYLDDIAISLDGTLKKVPAAEWNVALPSLAKKYKNDFLVGNIMEVNQTSDPEITAMYKRQYNAVTAGNDMKPLYLSPSKGLFDFSKADILVGWAKANGMKVHGHTLVWHIQSAAWLTSDTGGKPLTRAEAKANLASYIGAVAGHFKGKLISWDVVNEALDDVGGIAKDWKTVLRMSSPWYIAYAKGAGKGESGADYIYDAFVLARQADPAATLYYNDYGETEAWKREAMALMTEDLNKKWKSDKRNTRPSRPLIEGLGMQAHYWIDVLDVADVDATLARFIKTGVKISVTELDIPAGSFFDQRTPPLAKADELKQALLYARLFEVYHKHRASIERVTFWGKADSESWRGNGSPTLFDRAFTAKQSFYAVIDSEAFLEKNK